MQEPVYEYIKGKGWVVQTAESYTNSYQGRIVTLYKRPPEPHERGWYAYYTFSATLKDVFDNLMGYERSVEELGWPGVYHYKENNYERENPDVRYVVTVVIT